MLREGREQVLDHHRQRDVLGRAQTSCISRQGREARSRQCSSRSRSIDSGARAYAVARAFDPFLVTAWSVSSARNTFTMNGNHSRGPRRSFHGQAARAANGLRRLLHESRGGGSNSRTICFFSWAPRGAILHGRPVLRRCDVDYQSRVITMRWP